MFALAERISADVICSTEPDILSGWEKSSDELLIWRRPDYNAAAVDAYIDYMARERAAHMEQLHKLRLNFYPHTMGIEPFNAQDEEKLWHMNLTGENLKFADLFPGPSGRYLLNDIEERLSEDPKKIFTEAKQLAMRIRTEADPLGMSFHVDTSPILSYCHGKFPTEYLISNSAIPAGMKLAPGLILKPGHIPANCIGNLEAGDVSMMKNKPHRGMGSPILQPKIWLGTWVPLN